VSRENANLAWQSKLVLLAVVPFAGTSVFLACLGWLPELPSVTVWTVGLSLLLGLITWKLRAATPAAAATGATITASLMFSSAAFPYSPWHTALIPVLGVSLLAFAATRIGRQKKERLGTAEARRGRNAYQIAANLGFAALAGLAPVQSWLLDRLWLAHASLAPTTLLAPVLAALAEAAADTVSSEIGQVWGGKPRMITTLGIAEPGQDGAISFAGTLAGIFAAAIITAAGTVALRGDRNLFLISCAGAIFGLFFDSLLGATLERRGWLNNDMVNFLSTASAAGFALGLLAVLARIGTG
jgi:uncharacterized protein (TIGR00297 family)